MITSQGTYSYLYDGNNVIAETTSSNTNSYFNGLGIDEKLAVNNGSSTYSFMSDQVNSTIGMTNSSENLINNNTYTPYGTRTKHNSSYATSNSLTSVDTNYTFTGREDDGNGLMYYRNRYYSPTMKRFISEDPIGLNGGINQYAYVGGNPLSFSDPDGTHLVIEGNTGAFASANTRLMQSSTYRDRYQQLDSSPTTYVIIVGSNFNWAVSPTDPFEANRFYSPYDNIINRIPTYNYINWDPSIFSDDGNNNISSSDTILAHEWDTLHFLMPIQHCLDF